MFVFENDLNEAQYKAAMHVSGPLLVIAGAGSGKTRVITYRIANLVQNHNIRPWRILAVTFTNKAAREMRDRVVSLLDGRGRECWVSTFHATCAKLLRTQGHLIGINTSFTIYDDSDQKAMVARCIKDLGHSDKSFQPRAVQHAINEAKQEMITADEYDASDFYRQHVKAIYQLYEKRMRDASALDFADLIYRTVLGMRLFPPFKEALQNKFDFVLVDEFQDTNYSQLEIVKGLSARTGNICVVGDDDQSIYSWRGAEIQNILGFDKIFPGTTTVTLDRNYRSSANILSAAHGVAAQLLSRHPKELWTDDAAGERVGVIEADDEREEARLVARAIRELEDDGFGLNGQAVFYRINAQSRVFEEVFRTMGIPYRVVGGMRFYERQEVKDVLAYLRLISNPADTAAFLRVINVPTRGIGKTSIEKLTALALGRDISLYDAIPLGAEAGIGGRGVHQLLAFRKMIEAWRSDIESGPHALAEQVLHDTGYEAGLKTQNNAEADARLENLNELLGSINDFVTDSETPTLASFLELVALQSDVDAADFDGEQVTLMTVHAAKGLEFDVVHVTGLEQGMFPYIRRGDAMGDMMDVEQMEEERRLCYVAMTRARKRLFLTRARIRRIFGQSQYKPASTFLQDIPPAVAVDLTPNRPSVSPLSPVSDMGASSGIGFRRAPAARASRPAIGLPKRPSADETWIDHSYDQRPANEAFRPGASVRHVRYGVGTIRAVIPGDRLKVDVEFTGFGVKTIIADYLEPG